MMLVAHPAQFFRACLNHPASLLASVLVVASYAVAGGIGTGLIAFRTREALQALPNPIPPAVEVGIAVGSTVAGIATVFVAMTLSLVLLDLAFSQTARTGRLWEFSAYAHYPQVLWAVLSIVIVAVWFHPAPLQLSESLLNDSDRLREVVEGWQRQLEDSPFQLVMNQLSAYVGLAVVALQCCALRVVSGFSLRGAWAAGIVLGGVFVVTPWAIQRF